MQIGKGAFGVVNRIDDNTVVKIADIAPRGYIDSSLRQEAGVHKMLSSGCERIARFIDAKIIDRRLHIYMQYYPFTLSDVELTEDEIDVVIRDVAEAIAYMHNLKNEYVKNGIAHRDIKTNNVLLDDNKRAYLTDFGFSRKDGHLTGTPSYLPPERFYDYKAADVWAFGVLIYKIVSGTPPFSIQDHESHYVLERKIRKMIYEPLNGKYGDLVSKILVPERDRPNINWVVDYLTSMHV